MRQTRLRGVIACLIVTRQTGTGRERAREFALRRDPVNPTTLYNLGLGKEAQSSINIAPTFPLIQFIATAGTNNVTAPSALSPQERMATCCGKSSGSSVTEGATSATLSLTSRVT